MDLFNVGQGKIIDTDRLKKDPFFIILIVCSILLMVGEKNFLNELALLLYGSGIGMALAIVVERIEGQLDVIERTIKNEKNEVKKIKTNRIKSIRKSHLNK